MKLDPAIRDQVLATVPSLRAFAISLCGNIDRADDLVQETLLRALANIDSFQPGTNMPAWLFTILRNLFRSEYRKRRREVEDADGRYAETPQVASGADRPRGVQEFRAALAKLPADQREALILVGASGFSYEEAADDLRLRGRHHQEPRQSRAHAAGRSAVHRQRRRFRPGSRHPRRVGRRRPELATSSDPGCDAAVRCIAIVVMRTRLFLKVSVCSTSPWRASARYVPRHARVHIPTS